MSSASEGCADATVLSPLLAIGLLLAGATTAVAATATPLGSVAASPAAGPAAGSPGSITVPHLNGIFLSINGAQANWTQAQWEMDLRAMKAVGIEFFCPRAAADGGSSMPSDACPLGNFTSFYPSKNPCFHASPGMPEGGAIAAILAAAKVVGLEVHLGLAWPSSAAQRQAEQPVNGSYALYYRKMAWLEWDTAVELWSLYGTTYRTEIAGIYTMVEESNSIGWFTRTPDLYGHYLEPLARDIKQNLSSELLVWASPYYVGNLTRHNLTTIMDPDFYGDWWAQLLEWCPHLDLIAPQDSMGAQGNSYHNVTDYLGAMARGSRRVGRSIWSNVELFEVWPMPSGKGRHPAPIERVKKQIANEVGLVDKLIAWEWHSCLSPNAEDEEHGAAIKQNYEDYKAYVTGGDSQLVAVAAATDTSWYGTTHHGPEFVNVRDFGARGDNVTDDTLAIQKAINWGRLQKPVPSHPPTLNGRPYAPARRAVVYLPPGRYVVTDTLVLSYFTQLRGSTVEPPTLVLRASSPGFSGPMLKPIIATAGGSNRSIPWWRDGFHANDMFYLEVHSLSIEVDPSNSGAVAIFWNVAQQTSLRDITIRDAAVGIDVGVTEGYATPQQSTAGVGGGGTIEDITIVGGRVGMRLAGSQFAMRGLHFKGQSETALHIPSQVWTFGFATVDASDTPALLTVDGCTGNDQLNNIVLLDVTLANITGPSAIVLPKDGIPLLLENLSYTGTAAVPAATVMAGTSVWLKTSKDDGGKNSSSVGRWVGWVGQNHNMTLANGIVLDSQLLASSRTSLRNKSV